MTTLEPAVCTRARVLSLSSIVQGAMPMMRAAIGNSAVLRVAVDPHAPMVEVDPIAMHRVLIKLVINASHAIRQPHGVIEIGVAKMSGAEHPGRPFVRLTVADNGVGMDRSTVNSLRQQLVDPDGRSGSGSGLSIVHRAVCANGGRLHIDSQPGDGTTIRIDLPAAPSWT